MNRMVALLPLALLVACSKGGENGTAESDGGNAPLAAGDAIGSATDIATSAADPMPKFKPVREEERNKTLHFVYSYPAQAAAIPALKSYLDAERKESRDQIRQDYVDANGDLPGPMERTVEWRVVANLPGWLSLSGDFYEYSGGAHGMSGTGVLLWDKAANRRREPLSLFTTAAAFNAALGPAYCAALNAERGKRREQKVDPGSGGQFDKCVLPSEVTVLLGSGDKVHFTRIGLIADPYMAGPYAEGSYEVTLPVTPGLIRAVKPEYRSAFAVGR